MLTEGEIMIDLREIRSVTEFQRHMKEYVERLKKKKKNKKKCEWILPVKFLLN